MAIFQTKCTFCGSAFEVGLRHLQAAGGAVRCGNCQNVFNAKKNLKKIVNTRISLDNGLHIKDAYVQTDKHVSKDYSMHMEDIDFGLDDLNQTIKNTYVKQNSVRNRIKSTQKIGNKTVEKKTTYKKQQLKKSRHNRKLSKSIANYFEEVCYGYVALTEHPELLDIFDIDVDAQSIELVNSINAEPLVLNGKTLENNGKIWLNIVFVLFALLLILVQHVWYNFEIYAADASWRPKLQVVCSVFPCTLPAQIDISKIKIENIFIKAHQADDKSVYAYATITNEADFAQPYPAIEIQLIDRNGTNMKKYVFSPRQYLQGELAGSRIMQALTQIRIEITIPESLSSVSSYTASLLKVKY